MPRSESKLIQELKKLSPTDEIATPDDIEDFCLKLTIGTQKFSFAGRQFIKQILKDDNKTIAVLKSRQVGYSVLIAALMVYHALKTPGIQILYCTDIFSHMKYFSKHKLRQFLKNAGVQLQKDEGQIQSYQLPNGSNIFLVSAFDEFNQSRGYSADILFIDEAQRVPLDSLINISEVLSQSQIGRMYLGGTGGFAGSSWENLWNNTSMQVWQDGKWIKQNLDAKMAGYHITQRMMPNWNQEDEDAKRLQSNPGKFSMEVEGRFVSGMEVPLPYSVAIQCFTDDAWKVPSEIDRNAGKIIASLDLAAGGEADTVLTISQLQGDTLQVFQALRYEDKLAKDLFSKINEGLKFWTPDVIASDAGGNDELLHLLSSNYEVQKFRLGPSHDPIQYKGDEYPVSKTFFVQKTISRFHDKKITVPKTDNNWMIEHLTAETAETVQQRTGGSYIRFSKMNGRKDDFLFSLVFAECVAFMEHDDNNPGNFELFTGIV